MGAEHAEEMTRAVGIGEQVIGRITQLAEDAPPLLKEAVESKKVSANRGMSIAHSHFRDCDMASVSFRDARLKSCLTLDCTLDRVDLRGGRAGRGRLREERYSQVSNRK